MASWLESETTEKQKASGSISQIGTQTKRRNRTTRNYTNYIHNLKDMNYSNTFFHLRRVQHLQRYAKVVEITIAHDPKSGFRVELIVHSPRYDRWVFAFAESARYAENEKEYQRLNDTYEQYER